MKKLKKFKYFQPNKSEHIVKTFELFSNDTFAFAMKSDLSKHYECKDCNHLFRIFNASNENTKCEKCSSTNVILMDYDNWKKLAEKRGIKLGKNDDFLVDLINMDHNRNIS